MFDTGADTVASSATDGSGFGDGLRLARDIVEKGRQLGGTALADRGRQLGAQHLQIRLRSVTQGRLALLEEDSRKRVALAAWKIPNSTGLRRYEERV